MGKLVQAFTTEGSDIEFSHMEEPVGSWCVRIPHIRLRVLRRCRRYNRSVTLHLKARWNTRGTLWSARERERERASVALSAEQERHTRCVSRCLKFTIRYLSPPSLLQLFLLLRRFLWFFSFSLLPETHLFILFFCNLRSSPASACSVLERWKF